jgi:hypothetical protein
MNLGKLLAYYEQNMTDEQRCSASAALRRFRLMVSGSASLPGTPQKLKKNTQNNRMAKTIIGNFICCGPFDVSASASVFT